MIEQNKLDDEREIERTLIRNAYFNGKNMKNQDKEMQDILKYPQKIKISVNELLQDMGQQVLDLNELANDKKLERLKELIERDQEISYIQRLYSFKPLVLELKDNQTINPDQKLITNISATLKNSN